MNSRRPTALVSAFPGFLPFAALSLSLAVLSSGCGDGSSGSDDETCQMKCETKDNCKGDDVCENGCCVAPPPQCSTTADCCPGQTCSMTRQCKDSAIQCLNDADCGGAGDLYCLADGICGHKACGPNGECPELWQSCFAGACVSALPCSGGCGDGAACVLASGTCYPAVNYCGEAATGVQTGYMAVFSDLDNVYAGCRKDALKCGVFELPAIAVSDLGRHASMDSSPDGNAVAAMYDGTHGDLVVVTYGADGKEISAVWADGVPKGAPVMGALGGPRGGVAENGEDVGQYTSIKVVQSGPNAGEAHIAYYDVSAASLRYVLRHADGSFGEPYAIDGGEGAGDVGLYADLALFTADGESRPAVAYFQKSAGNDTVCGNIRASEGESPSLKSRMTALKFARAKSAHPASASDWEIQTVACHVMPEPACEMCPLACIADENSPTGARCIEPTADCLNDSGEKKCKSSQLCLNGTCHDKQTYEIPLTNFTMGTGLFPSLAFASGSQNAAIASYDSASGNLVLSTEKSGQWTNRIVDGEENGQDTGDTGLYPAIAFDAENGNSPLIAYHDATRGVLRLASGRSFDAIAVQNQLTPSDAAFIDRGYVIGAQTYAPPSSVGADVQLLSTDAGLFALYQDMTKSDLVLRQRQAGGTWKEVLRISEGAVGYYASLAKVGGSLLLGSAKLQIRPLRDNPKSANSYAVSVFPLSSAH